MARTVDTQKKQELLERCLEGMSRLGVEGLSLRNLAKEVDVSARMLVFHFGSAESLFLAATENLSNRAKEHFKAVLAASSTKKTVGAFFKAYWLSYTDTFNVPRSYSLLSFEIYSHFLRDSANHQSFYDEILVSWMRLVEETLIDRFQIARKQASAQATFLVDLSRGFLLDSLATGDSSRIKRSIDYVAKLIDSNNDTKRKTR